MTVNLKSNLFIRLLNNFFPNFWHCFREVWIQAIQSVAERLQVLDESDIPPATLDAIEAESKKQQKKMVSIRPVSILLIISY